MKHVRKIRNGNRRTQLHSLIDMAFILLLFFLVTSMLAKMGGSEQKLAIPTPKNEPGRAQVVIQIIDENRFWYLGEAARQAALEILQNTFLSDAAIKEEIIKSFRNLECDRSRLLSNIEALKAEAAQHSSNQYFVVIRCPDELPYGVVMDIIQALSGDANIRFGCVGGVLSDITQARRFSKAVESHGNMSQTNVIIDF